MESTEETNRQIAQKLFNEEFVSVQPEEYTQYLASGEEESDAIREYYMDLFNWDASLLNATRQLCARLHLKGESQEIDRILTSFTKSYLKQHPVNVFNTRNFEKIYIILYSLILLNTSLHNSEVSKKSKIAQTDYIRNTFTTYVQQEPRAKLTVKQRITIERELAHFYDDLLKQELHLKSNESDLSKRTERWSLGATSTPTPTRFVTVPHADARDFGGDLDDKPTENGGATTTNEYTLTKQTSNGSIWSTDTNAHRASLTMKRMTSATSAASQLTAGPQRNGSNARVGFTRALMSDSSQRLYGPSASNGAHHLRTRQSADTLRNGAPTNILQRRSSKVSMVSRDSLAPDDTSMVSLGTEEPANIDFVDDVYQQDLEDFNASEYQDRYDLTLELQGSPYLKEGLLKLKILNNDQQDNNAPEANISSAASTTSMASNTSRFFSFFSRRSQSQESTNSLNTTNTLINKFVEYFVVVSKGELSLYSFDPKIIKKHQQKVKKFKNKQRSQLINTEYDSEEELELSDDKGDGNWLKNAANVGNYNLCSTFAQLEKPAGHTGGKKTNTVLFSVIFPRVSKKPNKKFIFEAGTKEIALEFVNTCNFWASKITAVPTLDEPVTSIEYGWTNLDGLVTNKSNFRKLRNIQKWEPTPTGIYLSSYLENSPEAHSHMMKQFLKTLNYYNNLKKTFREFNEMKLKFVHNFSSYNGSSNYNRIASNYDHKIAEYKAELRKYKNYLIILGFGLQLRFDLEDDEKNTNEADAGTTVDETSFKTSTDEERGSNEAPNELSASKQSTEKEGSDLSTPVKYEIRKLFVGLKDVGRIIPTFQTSKSLANLNSLQNQIPNLTVHDLQSNFSLVKSPKTYTLSFYNDDQSPINQLLQTSAQRTPEMGHSFSTNTITEEEEPEDK